MVAGAWRSYQLSVISYQGDRLQLVVQKETLFAALSVRHRQEKSDALPRRLVGACWFLFFHFLEQLFDALDMFLRKVQRKVQLRDAAQLQPLHQLCE